MTGEIIFGVITGISLAAACGFRVFIPLLVTSICSLTGLLNLSTGDEWIGSTAGLIAFSVATVLEVIGYYSPWIDNALDMLSTPLSIIAGTLVTASFISDINPLLQWAASVIFGGGAALSVQLITVKARAMSSLFSGGLANPIFSTVENFVSLFISLLAVFIPLLSLLIIIFIIFYIVSRNRKKSLNKAA